MEETLNTPIEEVIETEAELVPAEEGETTPEETFEPPQGTGHAPVLEEGTE